MYCGKFEAVMYCLHATFALDKSTWMNKLQSGPPRHGQILRMAKNKLGLFCRNNINLRGCPRVAATGGTRRAHNCIHVKDILLLADSNYITWAPSIPCCLLLRPPVSRFGILQKLLTKTQKNFRIIIRRVQVRSHGYQRLKHSSTESQKRGACVLSCKHRGLSRT